MTDQELKNGVLYIAFGDQYRREASRSLQSLREVEPNIPVCVITDREWDIDPHPDIVIIKPAKEGTASKPCYIGDSPFQRTLFLDTDTLVILPISEIFDLLDWYDIGLHYLPMNDNEPHYLPKNDNMLHGLYFASRINSGVVVYDKNERITALFADWWDIFQLQHKEWSRPYAILDDFFLPKVLARSAVRATALPPSTNCYIPSPQILFDPVAIIHGRGPLLRYYAETINQDRKTKDIGDADIWIPLLRGTFPRGGIYPPGMWLHDPLFALSILLRRIAHAIRLWFASKK